MLFWACSFYIGIAVAQESSSFKRILFRIYVLFHRLANHDAVIIYIVGEYSSCQRTILRKTWCYVLRSWMYAWKTGRSSPPYYMHKDCFDDPHSLCCCLLWMYTRTELFHLKVAGKTTSSGFKEKLMLCKYEQASLFHIKKDIILFTRNFAIASSIDLSSYSHIRYVHKYFRCIWN